MLFSDSMHKRWKQGRHTILTVHTQVCQWRTEFFQAYSATDTLQEYSVFTALLQCNSSVVTVPTLTARTLGTWTIQVSPWRAMGMISGSASAARGPFSDEFRMSASSADSGCGAHTLKLHPPAVSRFGTQVRGQEQLQCKGTEQYSTVELSRIL